MSEIQTVGDGKYGIEVDEEQHRIRTIRNGEYWQEETGNKFLYCVWEDLRDLRAQLAAATDGVRDWKNAHALLKEQFHKQRVLLEAANKRLEEAEKQEPVSDVVLLKAYTKATGLRVEDYRREEVLSLLRIGASARPIPPEDVAECTRSHPHENMSTMCELRTQIAKLDNEASHNADLNNRQALRIAELERKLEVSFSPDELHELQNLAREEGRKEAVPEEKQ